MMGIGGGVDGAVGGQWQKEKEKEIALQQREREQRWLLVVGLATCGGADGRQIDGGVGWWLEQRRERGREKCAETGGRGLVFWRLWTRFSSSSGHEIHPCL
jgi:hypothetical protein